MKAVTMLFVSSMLFLPLVVQSLDNPPSPVSPQNGRMPRRAVSRNAEAKSEKLSPSVSTASRSSKSSKNTKSSKSLKAKSKTKPAQQPPTSSPTPKPSSFPSAEPSFIPTIRPTIHLSFAPTLSSSTIKPSPVPSSIMSPTHFPSTVPSAKPSSVPSTSFVPTFPLSTIPTIRPSLMASSQPSVKQSSGPSSVPSFQPSLLPTSIQSGSPIESPSVSPSSHLMDVCGFFQSYVSSGNTYHRTEIGIDWVGACADVDPQDMLVCPSGDALDAICTPPLQTDLNPAVRIEYCSPLFESMGNETDIYNECVDGCVKYVSRSRGDCCDFVCEGESLSPSSHPSLQPSTDRSVQPSSILSTEPSTNPSSHPSLIASSQPSVKQSSGPSSVPSFQPSFQPSLLPTSIPTGSLVESPSVSPSSNLMAVCGFFQSYVSAGNTYHRNENGTDWVGACADVDPQDMLVCPAGDALDAICTPPLQTDLNPAVRIEYCSPLFESMGNETDIYNECVDGCVKYVSRSRGDCCDFVCEGEEQI